MHNAKLVMPTRSFWIFSGCTDQDHMALRDCAEATALEARLLREYSEVSSQKDSAIGPVHASACKKALPAAAECKDEVCQKE